MPSLIAESPASEPPASDQSVSNESAAELLTSRADRERWLRLPETHVVFLVNFVPQNLLGVFQQLSARVKKLTGVNSISVMKNSLRWLDSVMTVSQHAKSQLHKFCERHQIESPPIHVTYESSSWQRYLSRRWTKRDEVIHLASSTPHKMTNRLLAMLLELQ